MKNILEIVGNNEFTFSREIIRDLHLNLTALEDKHFVILNGISGTGKTKLCNVYANAVYGLNYKDENPYFKIIPVRPDWIDSTALFGYYSAIEKRYIKTEFLDIILNALKEIEKPHFIVLDEMNLARVEYYLSDYLSAIESGKKINLHKDDNIDYMPKEIELPSNIYVMGTVNVDETTYSISDKVLDRAFVMTLSDVDIDGYWEKANYDNEELKEVFDDIAIVHKILTPYELHFGYRTISEMMKKVQVNFNLPEDLQMSKEEVLDKVICEKVFPKIRGDERISSLLGKLKEWTIKILGENSMAYKHLDRMEKELEYYGAAQFWR